MRGSRNYFCPFFSSSSFLVDEWWEDPNTAPSSARQHNTFKMASPWRADDDPTLNAGSVAS